ncbi:class I SAM-dependent methyltransferase [Marinobacteraceae bacterium S3BR75-40.1]
MRLEEVSQYYDKAAGYYDRATRILGDKVLRLGQWRAYCLELLGPLQGKTVLDVGCGTGLNLPGLEARVGPEGYIVAIDYSEGMLAEAQRRVDRNGWHNVALRRDDAARLDTVQEPVDAIVAVWSLGIVHDLEAALTAMLDRLKPGGHLAIMDFGQVYPDRRWLRPLVPLYSSLLEWARIDTAEDLDDERLRHRWALGKARLKEALTDVTEREYLWGTGFVLGGIRP